MLPVVDEFLRDMAPYEGPKEAAYYRDVKKAVEDKEFQDQVERNESLNFLLRDTISLTMIGGSGADQRDSAGSVGEFGRPNIARRRPESRARSREESGERSERDDRAAEPEFRVANYSGTDNALFAAIREVSASYFPGTPVVPHITSGYTENQRYRPMGIVAYGFNPYTATDEEGNTEHGNDERIRVDEVKRGPMILFDVVSRVAGE